MARNLEGGRSNVAGGGDRSSFTFYVFVVILDLMIIAASFGNRQSASSSTSVVLPPEESTAFEVFVVTWPPGFCSMHRVTCTRDSINDKWVAHGIWGVRADGTVKKHCPIPAMSTYATDVSCLELAAAVIAYLLYHTSDLL
ncbi:unnamed protein product [Linum trigynum]|uniref:Uncharacterized protein n=1 Tax=Linum trigynum TaxID=586398 RepID=A0AAV2E4R5_9ROSI